MDDDATGEETVEQVEERDVARRRNAHARRAVDDVVHQAAPIVPGTKL
jgi:hypothetical protein